MRVFESLQGPLAISGFGVIAVVALQVGACSEGQATATGSVTGVTGITAVAGSTSTVVPQNEHVATATNGADALAATSGPGATTGATMPSVVGSSVASGVTSGVGSGAGSAGTGR